MRCCSYDSASAGLAAKASTRRAAFEACAPVFDGSAAALDNVSVVSSIDLSSLSRALAVLDEALVFWNGEPEASPLKRHLRSAVVQSFDFTYELCVRSLRRVLMERAISAGPAADVSFNDLMRLGADAGLIADPIGWRRWREARNATSHAYNEARAIELALAAVVFASDARSLLAKMEASLAS